MLLLIDLWIFIHVFLVHNGKYKLKIIPKNVFAICLVLAGLETVGRKAEKFQKHHHFQCLTVKKIDILFVVAFPETCILILKFYFTAKSTLEIFTIFHQQVFFSTFHCIAFVRPHGAQHFIYVCMKCCKYFWRRIDFINNCAIFEMYKIGSFTIVLQNQYKLETSGDENAWKIGPCY